MEAFDAIDEVRAPARTPEGVFIAITFDDGSVGIMQFIVREYTSSGATRWARAATREAVVEEIRRSSYERAVIGWRFMEHAEVAAIPADWRAYRRAWRLGETIEIDMPTARDIHRDRLRRIRAPKLEALDIQYMRAMEAENAALCKTIAVEKQTLRDCTDDPAIEAATTIDELKAVIPEALRD